MTGPALKSSFNHQDNVNQVNASDTLLVQTFANHAARLVERSSASWPGGGKPVVKSLQKLVNNESDAIKISKKLHKDTKSLSTTILPNTDNPCPVYFNIKLNKSQEANGSLPDVGSVLLHTGDPFTPVWKKTINLPPAKSTAQKHEEATIGNRAS